MSFARKRSASCGMIAVVAGVLFLFFVPAGASPVTNQDDAARSCSGGTDSTPAANDTGPVVNRVIPDDGVCSVVDGTVSSLGGGSSPHDPPDATCEGDCRGSSECGGSSEHPGDCRGSSAGDYDQPPRPGSSDSNCGTGECSGWSGDDCRRPRGPDDDGCRRGRPP